ncbi:MAG: AraC family transcriptional regulator [Kiritimatiellae bacterium]|nr:AraC family transcriptional regulator [Kiritimatiellia bacterium]MDD5520277.1 AraC family transcriptional regulator [Kiritimatiellia bacterium]
MDTERFQHDFMSRVYNPWQFTSLLEHLPDVYFFAKNRDSQFVMANNQFLDLLGLNNLSDAISKSDLDFFEYGLASEYIREDRMVADIKRTVPNQLWMVPNLKLGTVSWFRSTKMPVYSRKGTVIGIAGIMEEVACNDSPAISCDKMVRVVDFISKNYHRKIALEELAVMACLSVSQFERRFRQMFHVSPVKYLSKVRVDAACRALKSTNRTLTDIALDAGFYDHSHFCRQFRKHTGVTPKEYRETRGLGVRRQEFIDSE